MGLAKLYYISYLKFHFDDKYSYDNLTQERIKRAIRKMTRNNMNCETAVRFSSAVFSCLCVRAKCTSHAVHFLYARRLMFHSIMSCFCLCLTVRIRVIRWWNVAEGILIPSSLFHLSFFRSVVSLMLFI